MIRLLQSYLRVWAKFYLKRTRPEIIAITGSISKTSTKEAIFEVLKVKFGSKIQKSEGNLNNETGVPLAVLGFTRSPKNIINWLWIILVAPLKSILRKKMAVLVLEFAADKPGDIKYLLTIAKPHIALITSIGQAHLAAFGTVEKIAQEKLSLFNDLKNEDWAIVNSDDEFLKNYTSHEPQMMTYAINNSADIKASNIETRIEDFKPRTDFEIRLANEAFEAETETLGLTWNVYSSLAAVACAKIYKMTDEEIVQGLANICPHEHRMNVYEGKNSSIIIDDSYNANPVSMGAALEVLQTLPKSESGQKIACLGDMLEIGPVTDEAHQSIGQRAKQIADVVIAVGNDAQKYEAHKYFMSAEEAGQYLLGIVRVNDIILIKASRAIGLDKVAEKLKK